MKSYPVYLLDLDDTLIGSFEHVSTVIYPKLADSLGLPAPDKESVRKHWGKELSLSLSEIFKIEPDEGTIDLLSQLHLENPTPPISGSKRILETLKKHGRFVGLYTAAHPKIMDQCLENTLQIKRDYFDAVFNTYEQGIPKPAKEIIDFFSRSFFEKTGKRVKGSEILIVGDSLTDFFLSKIYPTDFCAVLNGAHSKKDFVDNGLDTQFIFPSISEALTAPTDHGIVAIVKNEKNEFLLIKEGRENNPYFGHWSGPHGRCQAEDILEEETVIRETLEECGVLVKPVRKLYTRPADTKIKTVSFWEAVLQDQSSSSFTLSEEVSEIGWIHLENIKNGTIPLYPGTLDFFDQYENLIPTIF
ncbi:MAG: HAD hydrolase-like protein [Lewinellaceae bacterium]|nr:HAD hydrolase-like protein [Lewinellaceae bacterium]